MGAERGAQRLEPKVKVGLLCLYQGSHEQEGVGLILNVITRTKRDVFNHYLQLQMRDTFFSMPPIYQILYHPSRLICNVTFAEVFQQKLPQKSSLSPLYLQQTSYHPNLTSHWKNK